MSVRAKFKVTGINKSGEVKATDPQGNPATYHPTTVSLAPVYVPMDDRKAGNDENAIFGFYTPCGSISLSINNDSAADQFVLDREYYVDFTPAGA